MDEYERHLALALVDRGAKFADLGRLEKGREDITDAVALLDQLKSRLGVDWPPSWEADLEAIRAQLQAVTEGKDGAAVAESMTLHDP